MKNKFLLMLLVSSLCLGFVACGDDDDDTDDYASAIEGTYKGNVYMENIDNPIATDAKIIIVRKSENVVTLSMDQTIMDLPIKIECTSDVVLKTDVYNISGNASIDLGGAIPVGVGGTVNKSGEATLNIVVGISDPPMQVIFKGKK